MPGGNIKGQTYLNKPAAESCRFELQVCLSMCDLFVTTGIKGLKTLPIWRMISIIICNPINIISHPTNRMAHVRIVFDECSASNIS